MAIYTSNTNRVTGLSGIDTESMIDKLMKAESLKYNRLEKEKILVGWKQDAYRNLIKSMQSFQNKWFSSSNISNNIGYDAFWNNYKTSVVDSTTGNPSNAITINSTTNSGKYDIEIIQKAETESFKGDNISTNVTGDADAMVDIINRYGDISLNLNLDGVTKEIKITQSDLTTAGNDIEKALNEKLKTAFGTTVDGKAKVAASKSGSQLTFQPEGKGHSLTITDGSARTNGVSFTTSQSLSNIKNSFEIAIDGYTASVNFTAEDDTDDKKLAKIQKALSEAKKTGPDGKEETKNLGSYVSISKDENGKLVIKNNVKDGETQINLKIDGQSQSQKLNPTGSAGLLGLEGSSNNINLNTKLTDALGKDLFKNSDEIKLNFGGKDVTINKDDTIQSLINKVNSSGGGATLEFNEVTNRFTLKSTQSGANGNIQINDPDTQTFIKDTLKIDMTRDENLNPDYTAGKDAIFKVDGVETTRPSNDVTMNGISFTINGTGKVTIGAESDVDATVDRIKEFVEDYNKLVEEFNTMYSTSRPKSDKYSYYEPLTDEEKKGMSDDEIKKYEEQAKKGLLDGDDYVGRFLSDLRKNVYKSVDIGGKSISLYDIGISTSKNYNDGGKLEIDESKLKKALQERGDEVRQLFTSKDGIASSIKKNIDDAIGSKGYLRNKAGIEGTISAESNDLTKELKDITTRLMKERQRLADKESYYFEMFGRMEAAMNQQNSQMAVLLGTTG